jgi:hypothetical protein
VLLGVARGAAKGLAAAVACRGPRTRAAALELAAACCARALLLLRLRLRLCQGRRNSFRRRGSNTTVGSSSGCQSAGSQRRRR